jgi:hypothetical protein
MPATHTYIHTYTHTRTHTTPHTPRVHTHPALPQVLLEAGRRGDAADLVTACSASPGVERDANLVCAEGLVSLAVGVPLGLGEAEVLAAAAKGATPILRRRIVQRLEEAGAR